MSSIKIENLSYGYDEIEILKNFNLEIENNEIVVILGPSGCGKTTLLRLIAGLEKINDGKIFINDKLVNDMEPNKRNVAIVFQNYALYPHMTVYENIAFPLKMKKVDRSVIKATVNETIKILNLEEFKNRYPSQLSGGQKQRVAIGRAMVRKPEVFLMDEPMSNLDNEIKNRMLKEIMKLHGELKVPFIYVTHDQAEAMTIADKIIVMRDGLIQQIGDRVDIYENPVNIFVAEFIGSLKINLIDGKIEKKYGKYFFMSKYFKKELKNINLENILEKNIVLGIRPEYIFKSENGPLKIDINNRVYLDKSYVYGSVEDLEIAVTTDKKEKINENFDNFDFYEENILIFDATSGNRIN